MGYGDYIHLTAVIRDLCNEFNEALFNVKDPNNLQVFTSNLIKKIKDRNKIPCDYGITNLKKNNNFDKFKAYVDIRWKGNVFGHEQAKVVFKNNPYLTDDRNYPNIIFITIKSDGYLERVGNKIIKLYDNQHVVDTYSKNFGLDIYKKEGEFYFLEEEISKVKRFLPNKKFILIEPQNHKNLESRVLSFDFMQKIVDTLKINNDIEIVQISPSKFADKESKFLNNCIVYRDVFTFREAILFGKYAELAIVPHGGMSIGLATVNTKVIAIYPCIHKVPMTTYNTEIPYEISDGNHYMCFSQICKKCTDLRDIFFKSNYNKIVDKSLDILRNRTYNTK